jgi:hypothetical protein
MFPIFGIENGRNFVFQKKLIFLILVTTLIVPLSLGIIANVGKKESHSEE